MREREFCDGCRNGVRKSPEALRAWLSEWNIRPEPLAHQRAIVDHVARYIGRYDGAVLGGSPGGNQVEVLMVHATKERPFHALVTSGVSRHAMDPPAGEPAGRPRIEFVLLLPPEWRIGAELSRSPKWTWPFRLLIELGRTIHRERWFVWCRHTYEVGDGPLVEGTNFRSLLFHHSCLLDPGFNDLALPGGEEIHFLSLWPLRPDELASARRSDPDRLLERLVGAGVTDVLDPDRRSIFRSGAGPDVRA
jgi:hypothetical protein